MENKELTYHIRIEYEGLGEHLYREFILRRDAMLGDIGLLIAVSFDTAMDREIRFEQTGRPLAVMTSADKTPSCELPSAFGIRLRSLKLKAGSRFQAFYDAEIDQPFTVRVIGVQDYDGVGLPLLVEGRGAGIVEGMDPFHFLPTARDLIAGGEAQFTYRSPSTGVLSEWDIRRYSIEEDRRRLSSRLALAAGMYK